MEVIRARHLIEGRALSYFPEALFFNIEDTMPGVLCYSLRRLFMGFVSAALIL